MKKAENKDKEKEENLKLIIGDVIDPKKQVSVFKKKVSVYN